VAGDEGHRLIGEHAGSRRDLTIRVGPAGQVNRQHVCRVAHLAQQVLDLGRQTRTAADADNPVDDQVCPLQGRRDLGRGLRVRAATNRV